MQGNYRYVTIDFFEHGLRVKNLKTRTEREQAYKLRHKIFVEQLKWVRFRPDGLERDAYDGDGMSPLGVYDMARRLIAHLRVTLPQRTFMMEKEFASLIGTPIRKTAGTVEVSRVCTESDTRKTIIETAYGRYHISMMLYKGLYQWCMQNSVHTMYMVIDFKLFRLLKLSGFPCCKVGEPTIMPDGVSAIAVRINWREFEVINENSKPHLLAWFVDVKRTRKAA